MVIFLCAAQMLSDSKGNRVEAATSKKVATFRELEQALMQSGEVSVTLKKNITAGRALVIKGKKTINGAGKYRIRRKTKKGENFKGTLLSMQGESLRLTQITLDGGGKSEGIAKDINGKLVEVASGTVILETNTKLCRNYNFSSYTDGGGGITIHKGGKVVMKSGSEISDNLTITGGSGVRVEKDATFVMEAGTIRDNVVSGQKEDSEFDGRGGAIHNRGAVWIKGGNICNNIAQGYGTGAEDSGGFGGGIYNQNFLRISGGKIGENQASFAGGAIYTNKSGMVILEGGRIYHNLAENMRGGGIYVSASSRVFISGGEIKENVAEHGSQIFMSSTTTGMLSMTGGSVYGEAGIYYGGGQISVSGNPKIQSIYMKGNQIITVNKTLQTANVCELCPEKYEEGKQLVSICSGESEEKVKKAFSLKKRKYYVLEAKKHGLYIEREKYKIKYAANGGMGSMGEQTVRVGKKALLSKCGFKREGYGFVGWSYKAIINVKKEDIRYKDEEKVKNLGSDGEVITLYALWVRKPVWTEQKKLLSFYESEFISKDILKYGLQVDDEQDGDLTEKIVVKRVILPSQKEQTVLKKLPTENENIGRGIVIFSVQNSFGISSEYQRPYEVVENEMPQIKGEDRYYFVNEYTQDELGQGKEDVLKTIILLDDVEVSEDLWERAEISWRELNFQKSGQYQIEISVKDQYGNRFYMKEGQKKQYGKGKRVKKEITVNVVEYENEVLLNSKKGYVRFINESHLDSLSLNSIWRSGEYEKLLNESLGKKEVEYEEVWHITREDKKKIKIFLQEQSRPLSSEANNKFLEQFWALRKE